MQITYLNLNMWEGGKLFPAIKEFLQKENPDILSLQEVFHTDDKTLTEKFHSIQTISSLFPEYEYEFAPELLYIDKGKKYYCGNAVFSRFPIVESSTIFYDRPFGAYERHHPQENDTYDYSQQPYNLLHTELKVGRKSLHVFVTHGIWGFHGDDTSRRLQMGDIISEQVKEKEYVILGGDFNLLPTTKTVKKIEKQLISVFGNSLPTTFNMRRKPLISGYQTSPVDMVFTSKNIKVVKKACPAVDISDHFPLICKFSY